MTLRLIQAGIAGGLISALILTLGQHILELPLRREALSAAGLDLPLPTAQMDALILRNLLLGIVFSTLLAAIYTHRAPPEGLVAWREALLWGLAGFVVLVLAPAVSSAPTVGELLDETRSVWWLLGAAGALAGLGIMAFTRGSKRWLGLFPLLLPGLISPDSAADAAPGEPPAVFAAIDMGLDLLFWVALSLVTAWVLKRMAKGNST